MCWNDRSRKFWKIGVVEKILVGVLKSINIVLSEKSEVC